jgi:hypothetical protein
MLPLTMAQSVVTAQPIRRDGHAAEFAAEAAAVSLPGRESSF